MRCNPGHSHRHIHHHHHHHSHCGPCYGGSVFTFSHHCGGHSGGFWGGFGAGLGIGLGNMLGGFINSFTSGFGNMFGSFGNMFGGFGMGGFGFGMPMMGGFGMPMMGGFGLPWAASYGGGTVKDDAYFASRYGTGKSSSTSTSSVESGEEVKASDNGSVSGVTGGTGNTDKVTINEQEVKIEGITINELKKMTDDDLKKIDAAKAKKILTKIGFLENGVGKMSTEYVVLKLLEISGVVVECANNKSAGDTWIKGKIINVKKDKSTNKLSYDIDCNGDTGASFKYLYHFEQQVDDSEGRQIFKVTTVYKNGSSKQGYLINDADDPSKSGDPNDNRLYYYDEKLKRLVKVDQSNCLISENRKNRTEVKEKDANSAEN